MRGAPALLQWAIVVAIGSAGPGSLVLYSYQGPRGPCSYQQSVPIRVPVLSASRVSRRRPNGSAVHHTAGLVDEWRNSEAEKPRSTAASHRWPIASKACSFKMKPRGNYPEISSLVRGSQRVHARGDAALRLCAMPDKQPCRSENSTSRFDNPTRLSCCSHPHSLTNLGWTTSFDDERFVGFPILCGIRKLS